MFIWILSFKKTVENWCVCPPQKLGLMRATVVIMVLVRKSSKVPKSSGDQSPQFKILRGKMDTKEQPDPSIRQLYSKI